ncbi:MAG TPA: hypothetical protein V6D08_08405 [Candidatus Obscuribacterales bacterium]
MLKAFFRLPVATQGHAHTTAGDRFFDVRWGLSAALDKQIDKSHYKIGDSDTVNRKAELMEHVIVSYKVGASNVVRAGFIEKITKEAMEFLACHHGTRFKTVREELAYNQAMCALVERVFDSLRLFSFQFNRSLAWPDLHVTCTKPAFVTEVLRYNKLREPIESHNYFRARLSTRYVSLSIRGQKDTIEFFLVPVDKVIGLSRTEVAYQPSACLRAHLTGDLVTWELDGEDLTEARLEVLCMDLFADLVRRSRDVLAGDEARRS